MNPGLGALLLLAAALPYAGMARAGSIPAAVVDLLPKGYDVIAFADGTLPGGRGRYFAIALAVHDEAEAVRTADSAPARPLLLFQQGKHGAFRLAGRNDRVVFRRNEGGQCDPFEDDALVATGASFTVQNSVACGQHWTDYVTFRFDPARQAFLFRRRIWESWRLNPSDAPGGDALLRCGMETRSVQPCLGRFPSMPLRRPPGVGSGGCCSRRPPPSCSCRWC